MAHGSYLQWPDCSITAWNPNQIRLTATAGITTPGVINSELTSGTGLQLNGSNIDLAYPGNINIHSGHLYFADCHLSNWNPNQARFYGQLLVDQDITVGTDYHILFAVNGYGWKGISGYPVVYTAGSVGAGGGSVYLSSGLTSDQRIYWDGAYIVSGREFRTDASYNFRSRGGTYYAGPSDQSTFQIWNPGEWRVTSSPGNIRALGVSVSEGGGAQGAGAYVNTASLEMLKNTIVELTPEESLQRILDSRIRPVSFQYNDPPDPLKHHTKEETEPDPDAPYIHHPEERHGFITEEVFSVVPQAITVLDTGAPHGLMIEALVPILWSAIRRLDERLQQLEAV
jgi:hypothetical protein